MDGGSRGRWDRRGGEWRDRERLGGYGIGEEEWRGNRRVMEGDGTGDRESGGTGERWDGIGGSVERGMEGDLVDGIGEG